VFASRTSHCEVLCSMAMRMVLVVDDMAAAPWLSCERAPVFTFSLAAVRPHSIFRRIHREPARSSLMPATPAWAQSSSLSPPRTRDTDRSDDFVSCLDRGPAGERRNVGQRPERCTVRIVGYKRCERARGVEPKDRPESAARVHVPSHQRAPASRRKIDFSI
jgi:hypothetical protein